MINLTKLITLSVFALTQFLFFSNSALAQSFDKDLSSRVDRENCLNALLKNKSVFIMPDIAALNIGEAEHIQKEVMCRFKQSKTIEEIGAFIDQQLTISPSLSELTVRQAELLLKENGSTLKATQIQEKLTVLLEEFEETARSINIKASSGEFPEDFTQYSAAVLEFSNKINLNSLVSDYEAYGPVRYNDSLFKFKAEASDRITDDTPPPFDFALPGDGNVSQCNEECKLYIENVMLARFWSKLWNVNSIKPLSQSLAKIRNAKAKYDYFFFEAGDGLYPWELWVNSLGKSNDILSPPKNKINFLHPSPIVYYDNLQGNIEPSMIVEVIGYTHLNYSQYGSLPIGASLAVDFQNDDVRYGGVIHLPIKGALNRIGLDPVAKIIPCEACSIAFLTDGDDDWSVGLKIDVARLLYSPDKAKSTFLDYIK